MGQSTPPKRPMYEELADTPWITRNRELNTKSYDLLGNAIDNLNRYDKNAMQATVDQYANYQWDQLNRNYQSAMNKNLARNYGRLGTTGSSSGLYTTDDLQRYYNNLAGNVSSNAASLYNQLVNQEYQRKLSNLDAYNTLFNTSGKTAQTNDISNWNIRNTNLDRQWANDMDAYQASKSPLNNILGGISGLGGAALQLGTASLLSGNPISSIFGGTNAIGNIFGNIGNLSPSNGTAIGNAATNFITNSGSSSGGSLTDTIGSATSAGDLSDILSLGGIF